MDKKNKYDLSLYRLERAQEDLKTAYDNYKQKNYRAANNRAYYSIFHSIRAILALEETDFRKHKDVISYFNKNYIHTEIFPKKIGHKIALASRIREDSDYDDDFEPSDEQTIEQINSAKEVLEIVEEYVKNEIQKNK